jgi:hypothetical protein
VGEPVTTLLAASASSSAQPGTLAFIIVFGMAVVLILLFRSMSKHLRKVNAAARQQQEAAKDPSAQTGPTDRPGQP